MGDGDPRIRVMRGGGRGGPRPPKVNIKPQFIILAAIAIAAVYVLSTSFFTVPTQSEAVVTRFGKYVRTVERGFHFKLPIPFERQRTVTVNRRLSEEFGFRTRSSRDTRTVYDERGSYLDESLMLTGDLNVLEIQWITQYQVKDPYVYLFKLRNVQDTFRDMNESVMRLIVGDHSVNEVLTTGRQAIALEVEQRLQQLCDQYQTGLEVKQVILQDVRPPDSVRASFNEVNEAQQERERKVNDALRDFNSVVPRAEGEALQMVQAAEGFAVDRVNRAKGEVAAFSELLEAYRRSPEVTRNRLYLETLGDVLPEVERKIVLDEDLKGLVPLLQLGGGGGE